MTAISIILPVYNGQETIERTINSLINQSFTDFELLICIDGSTDDSENIIKAMQDARIRLIGNETNMGLGRTLNRLVANTNAVSKYVAMAEQDDFYYPNRLKLQFDFMEQNADTGLVSGIAEHYNGDKVTFTFPGLLVNKDNYPKDRTENFLLNYCYQVKVANSCMMFRKSVFIDNGLYFSMHYPGLSVDWTFILRFSLVSRIQGIQVPLVMLDRRPNRNSLTSKKKLQFAVARKVIKDFHFEYPNIITQKHFKTALTTEYLLELSHMSYLNRIIAFPLYFFRNPYDERWKGFIKKNITKLFRIGLSL